MVTAPILQAISVTPSNASLALGLKLQYFATAQFSDHSTQDVTNSATWSASDVGVATVSNSAGTLGIASSIASGSTSITATYQSVPGSTGLTAPGRRTENHPSKGRNQFELDENLPDG